MDAVLFAIRTFTTGSNLRRYRNICSERRHARRMTRLSKRPTALLAEAVARCVRRAAFGAR